MKNKRIIKKILLERKKEPESIFEVINKTIKNATNFLYFIISLIVCFIFINYREILSALRPELPAIKPTFSFGLPEEANELLNSIDLKTDKLLFFDNTKGNEIASTLKKLNENISEINDLVMTKKELNDQLAELFSQLNLLKIKIDSAQAAIHHPSVISFGGNGGSNDFFYTFIIIGTIVFSSAILYYLISGSTSSTITKNIQHYDQLRVNDSQAKADILQALGTESTSLTTKIDNLISMLELIDKKINHIGYKTVEDACNQLFNGDRIYMQEQLTQLVSQQTNLGAGGGSVSHQMIPSVAEHLITNLEFYNSVL